MMLGQRWPDIFTHIGSMGFQCWAGLLVTLGQRWPNVAHIRPTLVQCWTNVMRKLAIHWANVGPTCWGNIGPMSKITLGQHHLTTLAQCNRLHWANVGPMLACYLGILPESQFTIHIGVRIGTCKCVFGGGGVPLPSIKRRIPIELFY